MNLNKFNLNFKPADTIEEFEELIKNKPNGLIYNIQDLQRFYKEDNERFINDNKIKKAMQDFEKSVSFSSNGGFCSGNFESLEENLTYRQLEEVCARLGISMRLCEERKGFRCEEYPSGGDIKRCMPSPNNSDVCFPCSCQ
ncbi:hypothetical protein [Sporosarcina jiandibaonis]|uniref:hypothetical protein n=1 Tax=Sporosarcina jiandibaonis TaxID=2715535 RepID=UPI0015555469|nr:hypothetical protein [Sporosarcina jiandibaonis]